MKLDPALAAWIESRLGRRLEAVERLVSGNSRTTWAARVGRGEDAMDVVLRVDAGDGPFSGTPLTLSREARVYEALQGTGVRIPAFYGYDAELDALALERAPGEPDWSAEVLAALLGELARLHALDPEPLDLPGARSAAGELELWAEIAASRIEPPSALVEFALALLRERFPGEPNRPSVLHGDPGIGNLLWSGGEISALLDWEMSHVGDPYDDLAFITVRTAMHLLPIPGYGEAVAASYFGDPAAELDAERLLYWQAFGVLRNVIICESSVSNRVDGRDQLVQRLLLPSVNRLLIGLLGELAGVELPPPPATGGPPWLPGAETLEQIVEELSAILPGIGDPELNQRGRRVRYLLSQFAETWPLAAELAASAAAEGPVATDPAERLRQLARAADREIVLFPRAARMAYTLPPSF